jgi:hypothetical protein
MRQITIKYGVDHPYKTINMDQIIGIISNKLGKDLDATKVYLRKVSHKITVELDGVQLYLSKTLVGKKDKATLTVYEKRIWLLKNENIYNKKLSSIDYIVLNKYADNYNLDIVSGTTHLNGYMPTLLVPGSYIAQTKWQTNEDIGTAIAYILKYLRTNSISTEVESEYFGNDITTKLYHSNPITLQLHDLKGIKDYYLDEKHIYLDNNNNVSKSWTHRHNNTLLVITGKTNERFNAESCSVYYKYPVYKSKLTHSLLGSIDDAEFQILSRTVQRDDMVGTQHYILRRGSEYIISTKWCRKIDYRDQTMFPVHKSFINQNKELISYVDLKRYDAEYIKSIKLLTKTDHILSAEEADDWIKPDCNGYTQLNWAIDFNNYNDGYSYNQMVKVLAAAKKMKAYGINIDYMVFRHEPETDKLYTDSERADGEYVQLLEDIEYNAFSELEVINTDINSCNNLDVKPTDNCIVVVKLSK